METKGEKLQRVKDIVEVLQKCYVEDEYLPIKLLIELKLLSEEILFLA